MSFPAQTNVDGSNPGPNAAYAPDTTQSPIGNLQMVGTFQLNLAPAAVAAASVAVQNFSNTGIGLKTTDRVMVNPPGFTAGVGMAGAYVSAVDQLSIGFVNPTAGSLTPEAGLYDVTVFRIQPNWTAPASGNQMDF